MLTTLLACATSAGLLTAGRAPAAPIADVFVDAVGASCATGDGSAANPVCTISAGIALAVPGDTIRIAPGTYVENLNLSFDLSLVGTGGSLVTIIDGGAAGSVINIPQSVTVTLDGLTVTNGRAVGGAGIHVDGNMTLMNSTVSGNHTPGLWPVYDQRGGGIGAKAIVSNFNVVTIVNSRIVNNTVHAPDYARGGGIHMFKGELHLIDSVVSGNRTYGGAGTHGGGIYTRGALSISGSTISDNQGGFGDAISSFGGPVRVETSAVNGSLWSLGAGDFVLTNSTLTGSVVRQNSIAGPGSIVDQSTLTVGMSSSGPAAIPVRNSIVTSAIGTFLSLGHNFIGMGNTVNGFPDAFVDGVNGDRIGTPASPLDPMLGPLQDNGGPTMTRAPLLGSPVIDAGDPITFAPFDQRGVPRPVGLAPDIGAFEGAGRAASFCNGDGGDQLGCTNCPCGNNAPPGTVGGCLNSTASSARLLATGDPSVTLPALSTLDLRFSLGGATPLAFCILNSGDGLAPTSASNPCFGLNSGVSSTELDGLRCAVANTRRHGGRSADANGDVGETNSPWGGEGGPTEGVALAGSGFAAGQTRYFQVIQRDDPLAVCARGLNTSQAVEIVFTP